MTPEFFNSMLNRISNDSHWTKSRISHKNVPQLKIKNRSRKYSFAWENDSFRNEKNLNQRLNERSNDCYHRRPKRFWHRQLVAIVSWARLTVHRMLVVWMGKFIRCFAPQGRAKVPYGARARLERKSEYALVVFHQRWMVRAIGARHACAWHIYIIIAIHRIQASSERTALRHVEMWPSSPARALTQPNSISCAFAGLLAVVFVGQRATCSFVTFHMNGNGNCDFWSVRLDMNCVYATGGALCLWTMEFNQTPSWNIPSYCWVHGMLHATRCNMQW